MRARTIQVQRSFAKGKERFAKQKLLQPFATAVIDPDWPYTVAPGMERVGDIKDAHKKGRLSGFTRNRDKAKNQYQQKQPLSIEQLKQLPVGELVGGYVLMWTVGPFLINGDASAILRAWGFEPVSIITWAKYDLRNRHGYGGVGFWFLSNAEFCVVAKRPGWPSIRTGMSSLLVEPKQAHSVKPEAVHELCEARFPGPFVEVFGRYSRAGWLVLGDESPQDGGDIRESLRKVIGGTFVEQGLDSQTVDAGNRARMDGKANRAAWLKGRSRKRAQALRGDDMEGDDLCPRLL